jgi:hypothetical protein
VFEIKKSTFSKKVLAKRGLKGDLIPLFFIRFETFFKSFYEFRT